jgi:hypothetical protein
MIIFLLQTITAHITRLISLWLDKKMGFRQDQFSLKSMS